MPQISKAQMSKLFYRLEKTYSAGIDLLASLRRESENGSPTFKKAMKSLADNVQKGDSLAESFAKLDNYFPPLVISIVKAGERGGRLEESFGRLSQHYDSLVQFRKRLLAGMAWPLFELSMAIFVVGALILIIGYIFEINDMPPIDWFGFHLGTTGNFILYCSGVVIFLGSAFLLVFGSIKGWFGTLPMRIARYIPLVGKTIECMALSRFAWTLSIAEKAGMKAQETAQLALESTQNFYFTRLVEQVTTEIDRRKQFLLAFRATNAFPEDFLMYVQNGETAGELAETMDRVSRDLQEKAESNLKAISAIGFALTFLFVAVVIGATVIILFQKLYLEPIQSFSTF